MLWLDIAVQLPARNIDIQVVENALSDEHLQLLREQGAGPDAFSFSQPFDPPVSSDRHG